MSLNVGCSWSRVFLLGVSGHMGRFFTQLLFHHPHSLRFFFPTHVVHNNGKCVCPSCSNKCFWGLRFQGLGFWVSVFIESQVLELGFLGHRIFRSWVFLVVSFLGLRLF